MVSGENYNRAEALERDVAGTGLRLSALFRHPLPRSLQFGKEATRSRWANPISIRFFNRPKSFLWVVDALFA